MSARVPALALALAWAGVLAATVPAQGPTYRERWSYLQLESRRGEVLRELAGRDDATVARVAELLAAPAAGAPFRPVAHALAHLRGVTADESFVLRASVCAVVLPEVCDPDGTHEACRAANVSVALPPGAVLPAAASFVVTVHDAQGETVWRGTIDRADERELRLGTPSVQVPGNALADGTHRVVVAAQLAGASPRPHDPVCSWTVHVLRGYQARAERALAAARASGTGLPPADQAVLAGAAAAVTRAFTGEPWVVASDGVRELERLERVLEDVAAGRPAAARLDGELALALPVPGGAPLAAVLRRSDGPGPRPLVVFAAGAPTYDAALSDRPIAPATRHPGWLAHELARFGAGKPWHVAFLESPGVGRDFATALREAIPLLEAITGAADTPAAKPVLVCEREAASVAALHVARLRPLVRGLVFVGGGAMAAAELQANGALPVRFEAAHGSGEQALERVLAFVAAQQQAGTWNGDVAWLGGRRPPWTAALPLLAGPIETFARECLAK